MNSTRLMTQAEFAAHRGVGKSAVSNYKSAGLLVFAEDPDTGKLKVDVSRSEAKINAKIDPTRGRATTGQNAGLPLDDMPAPPSPASAAQVQPHGVAQVRMELVQQQVIERRFANARRAGELAPMVELEKRAQEIGRVARERMQSLLRTMSDRWAAEKDPRQIVAVGALEIDRVFAELADMVEAGALTSDDTLDDELAAEVEAEEATDEEEDALAEAS